MPVYVENALLGMDENSAEYKEFLKTPLIFIYSDPTSGDGDGDGISDPEDIMPLVTLNYKSTKFSEFVDTAEFFEIKFILECLLMKGYTADECVDCIEILRKYTDTNDVEAFQQAMISAGLISPNAAAPATWFDKIMWGAWSENGSAPLLNEYENFSRDTSFEEMFEQSAEQWSDTCKTALSFWAFGLLQENLNQMSEWDYSLYYKINLSEEQTRIIYDDLEVATKVEKIKTLQVQSQSATEANMELYNVGYTDPPYMANTNTQIIMLEKDTEFVRVLNNKNNPLGKWFMLEDDIKGLSALEIQDKYAIPVTPTKYIHIKIPAGSTIRVGKANGLYGFSGGGVQFDNYGMQMFEDWITSDYIFL